MKTDRFRAHLIFSIVTLVILWAGQSAAQSTTGWIRLDSVTNQLSPTKLIAGNTHRVAIRYHFPDEAYSSFWCFSNAFELYSPDGADWSNLVEQDGALIVNCRPYHVFFKKYYTSQDDGSSWQMTASHGTTSPGPSTGPSSRVAFSVAMVDAGGYACYTSGLDGIMFYLDFQTHSSDIGRTICLDTVNGRGTVPWEWAGAAYGSRIPVWDDGLGESAPRCWEIACTGPDTDEDAVPDMCDACPGHPDYVDTDADGFPDGCDPCIGCEPEDLAVSIDAVEGLQAPGVLASGRPLQFRFRFSAGNDPIGYFTSTLLLYSPDGAVWSPAVLDTVDGFDALTSGAVTAIWNHNDEGHTCDTLRIMTGSITSWPVTEAFPPGFSEVLFTIETSVDADQAGLTLCIDRPYNASTAWFSAWNIATGSDATPALDWTLLFHDFAGVLYRPGG